MGDTKFGDANIIVANKARMFLAFRLTFDVFEIVYEDITEGRIWKTTGKDTLVDLVWQNIQDESEENGGEFEFERGGQLFHRCEWCNGWSVPEYMQHLDQKLLCPICHENYHGRSEYPWSGKK